MFERYRLVVVVNVGNSAAGIAELLIASRCLWDARFDSFVQASINSGELYVAVVVFAIYTE